MPTLIGLIPARSGSKRVPHKNIKPLAGHPLIAYSISAALDSGVFAAVVVSTDSEEYAAIARHYGAEVPPLRPADLAGETSPDIEWVEHTLTSFKELGRQYDCFSILRPTSPFRTADTIRRAWGEFCAENGVDSLRAVEKCHTHPAKMWVVRGKRMVPLLPLGPASQPWHSSQYPTLLSALQAGKLDEIAGAAAGRAPSLQPVDIEFLPVITEPGKIFCVGHNYEEHRLETGRDKTQFPLLFLRVAE